MSTAITPLKPIGAEPTDLQPLSQPNKFYCDTLAFYAMGDRVLILEDEFKTGYECSGCGGSGRVVCESCDGTGKSKTSRSGARCATCAGEGSGTCTVCDGKGGLIVAPETAQRRPTTGKVVSVGHKVQTVQLGQSVMYSNFAGFVVDLKRAGKDVCLRLLHENEILCGMEGHLTLSNLKGKSEIAFHEK